MKKIRPGDEIYICECFFDDMLAHPTKIDKHQYCVYCGHFCLKKKVSKDFYTRHQLRRKEYQDASRRVVNERIRKIIEGDHDA